MNVRTLMNIKRIAIIFAAIELVTALTKYGIYTMPIRFYGMEGYWSLPSLGTNLLGILFLALPITAIISLLKGKNIGFLWMGLFPIVAFVFGVVPIPFANYLYSSNVNINTVFIAIINILAVTISLWLYRSMKVRSNKKFNMDSGADAPPPVN